MWDEFPEAQAWQENRWRINWNEIWTWVKISRKGRVNEKEVNQGRPAQVQKEPTEQICNDDVEQYGQNEKDES